MRKHLHAWLEGMGSGKRLLMGVCGGLAGAVVVLVVAIAALPAMGPGPGWRFYDYVYASGKSESSSFVTSNMAPDSHLVFGSSELYISKDTVSTCPQAVLGEGCADMDMTYVGEAFDQSLWQAIAAGAYANKVQDKKVMIIVSPQWFFQGSGQESKFPSKFSYSLYQEFCDNPSISDETKDYVRQRVLGLGVDGGQVAAANRDTPADALNGLIYYQADQLSLRSKLVNAIGLGPGKNTDQLAGKDNGEPDWSALLAEGKTEGARMSTSNEYGINDSFWSRNADYDSEWHQTFDEASSEYTDLACFLQVCHESGLDPLVCIVPLHGAWYDHAGVGGDVRQYYYQRIRDICDDAGVSYADFSSCEYEPYFLCDTVHPGWVGWVRIEEAFYDFVKDRGDAFLGGAGRDVPVGLSSPDATQPTDEEEGS